MAPRISLALAIHNHQPVGNFGWVFAEVYEQAYLPMVEALERHPGVRLSLHYTGPLLEWLAAERPDLPRAAARAGRPRPGRDPGRRPVRAGPRLAARAATGSTSSRGWPSVVEGIAGRRPLGALAGRARLGAGPADGAGRRGLPLDDPRRPALPGGVDPRGEPVGRLHDRGPGPAADGLRDRAGPALPDPVRGRRGRHRLPPRPRHRGGRPGRDDGRRRREVRRLADDLRALLGRRGAGSSGSSRRSRRAATG